ncbi:MAG TPA: DUF1801 domain-containing protein [Microbacteriaceae bacterium]|jgi:hypothetical protein|nr:DUF1801 domain-containing protein [Microbacteriaceae bacterium]HQX36115.1 DUF1801 domain-containing protein [Microbacteriaceae bacterium]HQZ48184.1 DUF1801 domain-containing protein [Microbacteriaceae bacterium]HRA09807.1 DUF1801 domain-containing protein [Microbacteriaceae bacterium]
MAKQHPHIDNPSAEALQKLVAERPAPIVEVYLAFHELLSETLPNIAASVDTVDQAIGYGAHQYGYNGWGVAAVMPYAKWVSLTFMQGSLLDDPAGLLTGSAKMRHVKLANIDELHAHRGDIRDLIVAASLMHAAK